MKQFNGVDITADHRREHREAKAQAILGIGRLNSLYAITGRGYRARLELFMPPAPILADDFWEPQPDPDDIDTERPPAVCEEEDGL